MNSVLLFLLGCIPARLLLIYVANKTSDDKLIYLGIILGIVGLSFLWLYFTNGRMNAPEAGGTTWWADFRLVHGLLYIMAAIYAIQKKHLVHVPLIIDLLFGVTIFTIKHKST